MMEGRKHRTAHRLGSALVILACAAALAPALASAQSAAAEEYELGDLPSAGGDNDTTASGADATSSGSSTSDIPAIPQDDAAVGGSTAGSDSGSGGDSNAAAKGGGGGDRSEQGKGGAESRATSPATDETIPAVPANASDGGGAPALLIVLAVVAAICTALAVWRLRRGGEHTSPPAGPANPVSGPGTPAS